MDVRAANNDYYLENKPKREPKSVLDKDAFLKIMMEQLKNQDPASPMDSDAFINQMAQFTMMEQLTNMNTQLTHLTQMQQLTQGASLIGQQVTVVDAEGARTGVVDKVAVYSDGVRVVVDGVAYSLDQIAIVGGDSQPAPPTDGEEGAEPEPETGGEETPGGETGGE